MAFTLDGRALATELRQALKVKIAALPNTPTLGVILVGGDPASHLYVGLKEKAAAEVGIKVEKIVLPEHAPFATVAQHIKTFNEREDVTAILIQLPVPKHLNEYEVVALMDPKKDADGFHPQNLSAFLAGREAVTPGLTNGIMKLIELAKQPLRGKTAALIVNSQEFAQPLMKLLDGQGVHTTVASETGLELKTADIIIVAVGKPGALQSEYVKDGAIVIDVGTTKIEGRVMGDAAPELAERAIYLTPVPGGVGPMTVAMLLWNVYELYQKQHQA